MDQGWTWEQNVPPRWLLIDDGSSGVDGPDVPLALCADIDGLFAEPTPPPTAEHYTLIGCDPAGPLREALAHAGTGRAWLGDLVLDPVHGPRRPEGCQPYNPGCSCGEELLDVTVLGRRPSAAGSGLVDVDLRGHLRILPEYGWPPAQPPAAHAFTLTGSHDGQALGTCQQTAGVFRERPRPPVRPVTLLGCRPTAPLQDLTERESARRRYLRATICSVDHSGHAVDTGRMVSATVTGAHPSRLGADLVDVVLDDGLDEPLPSGARAIWESWRTGRPAQPVGRLRPGTTAPLVRRRPAPPPLRAARPTRREHLLPRRPLRHRHRGLLLRAGRGDQRPRRLLRLEPLRARRLPARPVGRPAAVPAHLAPRRGGPPPPRAGL